MSLHCLHNFQEEYKFHCLHNPPFFSPFPDQITLARVLKLQTLTKALRKKIVLSLDCRHFFKGCSGLHLVQSKFKGREPFHVSGKAEGENGSTAPGNTEKAPPLLPLALSQALLCGIALGASSRGLALFFFQNSTGKQKDALSFRWKRGWIMCSSSYQVTTAYWVLQSH